MYFFDTKGYKPWEYNYKYPARSLLPEDKICMSKIHLLHAAYQSDRDKVHEKESKQHSDETARSTGEESTKLLPSRFQRGISNNDEIMAVNKLREELFREIQNNVDGDIEKIDYE